MSRLRLRSFLPFLCVLFTRPWFGHLEGLCWFIKPVRSLGIRWLEFFRSWNTVYWSCFTYQILCIFSLYSRFSACISLVTTGVSSSVIKIIWVLVWRGWVRRVGKRVTFCTPGTAQHSKETVACWCQVYFCRLSSQCSSRWWMLLYSRHDWMRFNWSWGSVWDWSSWRVFVHWVWNSVETLFTWWRWWGSFLSRWWESFLSRWWYRSCFIIFKEYDLEFLQRRSLYRATKLRYRESLNWTDLTTFYGCDYL